MVSHTFSIMTAPTNARSQQKRNHNNNNGSFSEKTAGSGRGARGPKTKEARPVAAPLPQRSSHLLKKAESAARRQHQGQQRPGLQPTPTAATQSRISPRGMTLVGVSLLAFSTYCGYLWTTYHKDVAKSQALQVPDDVSHRFNEIAREYDAEVELGERLMRLGARRKELVRMARGDVLEVSCGTGRNMAYYQLGERRGLEKKTGRSEIQGCRSVTFVDLSPEMVDVARRKFERLFSGHGFSRVAFRAMSASELKPPFEFEAFEPSKTTRAPGEGNERLGSSSSSSSKESVSGKSIANVNSTATPTAWSTSRPYYFDTVLQTMGLCSTPDPVGMLRHLGAITEPEHGQILLLEHGRSYYDWLNTVLDNLAAAHATRYGCWWNRDIGQIIEQSGLEVVDIQRYHLGTTWKVILRPKLREKIEQQQQGR